jgi:hypothetical protein
MNLERLAKISPVIGAFLIFIGYWKLHLYYKNWDIKISDYLDISEIMLSFLNDSNIILFFIFIMLAQMTIGIIIIAFIDRKIKNVTEGENKIEVTADDKGFEGILPLFDKSFEENSKPIIIVFSILSAISIILFFIFYKLTFLYFSFILFSQLLILILYYLFGIKNDKKLMQISFVIIIFGFSYSLSKYDINETNCDKTKVVLYIENDKRITSSDNFIFLGKTKNYFFFFDKCKNKSHIIKGEKVSRIISKKPL